jgi:hypothetical protein
MLSRGQSKDIPEEITLDSTIQELYRYADRKQFRPEGEALLRCQYEALGGDCFRDLPDSMLRFFNCRQPLLGGPMFSNRLLFRGVLPRPSPRLLLLFHNRAENKVSIVIQHRNTRKILRV